MRPGLLADGFERFLWRPRLPVRPIGAERLSDIDISGDARRKPDGFPLKPLGVSSPIPAFMMAVIDVIGRLSAHGQVEPLLHEGAILWMDHAADPFRVAKRFSAGS